MLVEITFDYVVTDLYMAKKGRKRKYWIIWRKSIEYIRVSCFPADNFVK